MLIIVSSICPKNYVNLQRQLLDKLKGLLGDDIFQNIANHLTDPDLLSQIIVAFNEELEGIQNKPRRQCAYGQSNPIVEELLALANSEGK
jgi:hypothetical protein